MKTKRLSFTLLEVLIALALVSLCLIPIISPYYMMVQESQKETAAIVAMRRAEKGLVTLVEEMYQQKIGWEILQTQNSNTHSTGFQYTFGKPLVKKRGEIPTYFLFPLQITIPTGNNSALQFEYKLFVEKKVEPNANATNEKKS